MSLSIMQLAQPGRFAGGQILLQGEDLLKKTEREMRRIRGNDVSMIFQEPMTSLNPVFTIGDQIAETISLHQRQSRSRASGWQSKCWSSWVFRNRPGGPRRTRTRCLGVCGSAP